RAGRGGAGHGESGGEVCLGEERPPGQCVRRLPGGGGGGRRRPGRGRRGRRRGDRGRWVGDRGRAGVRAGQAGHDGVGVGGGDGIAGRLGLGLAQRVVAAPGGGQGRRR